MFKVLRRATILDVLFWRRVRNEKSTRAVSWTTEEIGILSHLKWFFKKLRNPEEKLFVIGGGAGILRISGDEIHIAIKEEFRRRGFAKMAIKEFIQEEKPRRLIAKVNPENIASNLLFWSLGFTKTGTTIFIRDILA